MNERVNLERSLGLAAEKLASLGYAVLPVHGIDGQGMCACGSVDCASPGKHPIPSNGHKAATTDLDQVHAWWNQFPLANVGLATGDASGCWALDVDLRDGGITNFEQFRSGRPCPAVEQKTGSGGRHLIFALDDQAGEIRNRVNVLPGVDVRGEGGYIIVAPSNHALGSTYEWIAGSSPFDSNLRGAPTWLLELVLAEVPGGAASACPSAPPSRVESGPLPRGEIATIKSALAAISPDCDYETWYRVGMALESTGAGEQVFRVWDEWSSTATRLQGSGKSPVYPGTAALRRRWSTFGRRDKEVRLESIFHFACQSGWEGSAEGGSESNSAADGLDVYKLSFTHMAFGRQVLARYGRDLRHCGQWKKWLAWDGKRWAEDQSARGQQFVTETQQYLKGCISDEMERVKAELSACTGDDDIVALAPSRGSRVLPATIEDGESADGDAVGIKTGGSKRSLVDGDADASVDEKKRGEQGLDEQEELTNQAKRLNTLWRDVKQMESAPARRLTLESMSWEGDVQITSEMLNTHPLKLNVMNGTLDLETLDLHLHRRGDLLTQLSPTIYNPKANCLRFLQFLEEAIPDPDVRAFLQRLSGHTLTGLSDEHCLVFLFGDGKNGKSTFLNALMDMLGPDYAIAGPPKLLVRRANEEHLTEIAALFGKRLVACAESGEDARLDEEKAKKLSGGDQLSARRMREDHWTFKPTHTIWLHSNHPPRVKGGDDGIWRRIQVVPFLTQPDFVDRALGSKLRTESSGILNWALGGLREFLNIGLSPPEGVLKATQRYRAEEDDVGCFLAECTVVEPGVRERSQDLHAAYDNWCRRRGLEPKSVNLFGRALSRQPGLHRVTSNGVIYCGRRLNK